jgi:hypothetical protein
MSKHIQPGECRKVKVPVKVGARRWSVFCLAILILMAVGAAAGFRHKETYAGLAVLELIGLVRWMWLRIHEDPVLEETVEGFSESSILRYK